MKRAPFFALLACSLFAPALASAADNDAARADQLFKDGTAALEERRFDVACPKLAESHKVDPKALGTLVNLARCNEEWGKTATAYAQYVELEQGATERKQAERIALAKKHMAMLETKLSHIDLRVQAAAPGETVKIDDAAPVDAAKLTATQTFDPGDHAIEATAPGKAPYRSKFTVAPGPSTADVIVPALADASAAAPPAAPVTNAPASDGAPTWSTQKTLGVVGVGVGAAGLILGGVFGAMAISGKSAVNDDCHNAVATCANTGKTKDDYDAAHTKATVSTISFIAGGVFVAAGAVLYLTAPTGKLAVAPAVGASSGGLTLGGSF